MSIIWRIINKSKIKRTRINRNFDIQMDHGFRKRFNTIMKLDSDVNSNLAEKMLGHSTTHKLDNTYFTPTLENLFAEFQKAIPELSISESVRLQYENKRKGEKIKKLEAKESEIEKLKSRFDSVERLLERITMSSDNNNSNC